MWISRASRVRQRYRTLCSGGRGGGQRARSALPSLSVRRAVEQLPPYAHVRRPGDQRFDDTQLLHLAVVLLALVFTLPVGCLSLLDERLVGGRVVRTPLARHSRVVAHLDRLVDDEQGQERDGEQYAGHGDANHQLPPGFVQVEPG